MGEMENELEHYVIRDVNKVKIKVLYKNYLTDHDICHRVLGNYMRAHTQYVNHGDVYVKMDVQ